MNRLALLCSAFVVLWSGLKAQAQSGPTDRNYYRNPLGFPIKLSANFGELRPDHWHMGLDIRTNARENMPVYAAAPGYIAHVGIRSQGYGRFIVINHPNGTSTLYAHLNNFNPELEAFVTEQQYKKESWAVELDFSPSQFPVSKGSFIAYSGNTGGSQGPHLHFEIIETATQKRFNPLLFNFNIRDFVPPSVMRLAIYDRGKSIYAQTPQLFSLKYTGDGYVIPKMPVIKTGLNKLSFAIQAFDRIEKGSSQDGIYAARLIIDQRPVIGFILDSIQFDERVYMNAHIDYRYDFKGGPYLQLLTKLPGDRSTVYKQYGGNGLINLDDTSVHQVRIEVKDAHGNISNLDFSIQHSDSLPGPVKSPWPVQLAPNKPAVLEKPGFRMKMAPQNLYDTVPAYYTRNPAMPANALTATHSLNDPSFPLHGEVNVSLQAEKQVPDEWKDKLVMRRTSGSANMRKAVYNNGWISADFGDFGNYQAFADYEPPTINDLGSADTINLSRSSQIVFTPADNFNVIRNFRVELDGQWIRFTNDKSRNWIYKFDERCSYGVHQLKASATDLAGNTNVKTWWFRREAYTPPPPKKKSVKSKKSSTKKGKK
jgi:hypothetical protein